MAVIRGAFGGGQIKGSIGGNTFQQSPYGTVIRNRTVPVNPNTAAQVNVRSAFDFLSNAWVQDLTDAQRAAWEAYAAQTPLPDKFGQPVATRGRQMFLRSNVARRQNGLTLVPDAPPTPGVINGITPTINLEEAGPTSEITAIDDTIAAGAQVIVRMGQPVNSTKNYYKAPFVTVAVLTSASAYPVAFTSPYVITEGTKYFFEARHYGAGGKVSFPIVLSTIAVA